MAAGAQIHASFQSGIGKFLINTYNEHLVYFFLNIRNIYKVHAVFFWSGGDV